MNYLNLFTLYLNVEPPKDYVPDQTYNNPFKTGTTLDIPYQDVITNTLLDYSEDILDTIDDYRVEQPILLESSEDNLSKRVVDIARGFIGGTYKYGSSNPDKAEFDCSGFILYIYSQIGIQLPRTSHAMGRIGTEVSLNEMLPGDIIYTSSSGPSGGHVKMVSDIRDGLIYTIEAKGKNYGIVENPLNNFSNIKSVRRVIDYLQQLDGVFSNKDNFIRTLRSSFRKELVKNGMSPDWAPMLVASAAIESGWGSKPSGNFNYGGLKVTDSQKQLGVSYKDRYTTDYIQGLGNVKRSLPFRNFESIDDYCSYMVRWLKNSPRYKLAFSLFNPNLSSEAWEYILRAGYGGGSESNILQYMRSFKNVYNTIIKV